MYERWWGGGFVFVFLEPEGLRAAGFLLVGELVSQGNEARECLDKKTFLLSFLFWCWFFFPVQFVKIFSLLAVSLYPLTHKLL